MPSKKPQFIIRTDKEILDKIAYIARENERSSTQEIVYLIKKKINKYYDLLYPYTQLTEEQKQEHIKKSARENEFAKASAE